MKRWTVLGMLLIGSMAVADEELAVTPIPPVGDTVEAFKIESILYKGAVCGEPARVVVKAVGVRSDGSCARNAAGELVRRGRVVEGNAARRLLSDVDRGGLLEKMRDSGDLPAGVKRGTPGVPTLTPTSTPEPTTTPTAGR